MIAEYWRLRTESEIRTAALEQLLRLHPNQPPKLSASVYGQCPTCSERALVPIGQKFHCQACLTSSDAFQDGDVCQ
jgi:hypothetical protein